MTKGETTYHPAIMFLLAFVGQVQNEDDNGSFWLGSIVGIRGEGKRGTLVK